MVETPTGELDWRRQLRGAFAFNSAPFAIHPNDERPAPAAIANAIAAGAGKDDIENEVSRYCAEKKLSGEFCKYQKNLFRNFFKRQYSMSRSCWVLYKTVEGSAEFIDIFSGKKALDDVLHHCMHIYEAREFNHATQFMRCKKRSWPTFQIRFHVFPSGALWEGKAYIGYEPCYELVRCDAKLSNGLSPNSKIKWRPWKIPEDPGDTWKGLRYS